MFAMIPSGIYDRHNQGKNHLSDADVLTIKRFCKWASFSSKHCANICFAFRSQHTSYLIHWLFTCTAIQFCSCEYLFVAAGMRQSQLQLLSSEVSRQMKVPSFGKICEKYNIHQVQKPTHNKRTSSRWNLLQNEASVAWFPKSDTIFSFRFETCKTFVPRFRKWKP